MSISPRWMRRLMAKLAQLAQRVRDLEQLTGDLQQRQHSYEARRDAMAVPPGSTLFMPGEVRLFRIVGVGNDDPRGRIMTLGSDGDMVLDEDDEEEYQLQLGSESINLAVGDVVSATYEGVHEGHAIYVIGAAGGSAGELLAAFEFREFDEGVAPPSLNAWRITSQGPDEDRVYEVDGEGQPIIFTLVRPDCPIKDLLAGDVIYAIRTTSHEFGGGTHAWWRLVVDLPPARDDEDPAYDPFGRVLQLTESGVMHWDHVRAI